MKSQRFGIEIEMTGLTRRSAALIIAKHFDTGFRHERGVYDTYSVCDQDGRKWKIVRDASITPQCGNRFDYDPDYKVEVVSPVCHYEDIGTIQSIVRELRRNGHAKVNESCGIHIHVDASKHTARSLRNIANIMYSKEDLIFKALKVRTQREVRFCKKIDDDFLEMLNRKKPKDIEEVENLWYDGNTSRKYEHYDDSRYHALNFHSVFSKGTIEFRMEHFMQVKSRPISSFVWQYLIRHWFKIRQAELRQIRLMRNIRSGLGFYDLDLLAMNLKQHDIIF